MGRMTVNKAGNNGKEKLREEMLARRLSMSESSVKEASAKIAKMFVDRWGGYESYLLYSPIKNEVDTAFLAEMLWNAGKIVLYPKVAGDKLELGQCCCVDDLQPGYKGIMEPVTCCELRPQVVVVPGLAFDRRCYRLGYGKAYYDRFLATLKIDKSVGVAFKWQIVETVFPEGHDQPVDIVLTD